MTAPGRPPALARWLLGRAVRPHDRDTFLADVDETYTRYAARASDAAAARWYWIEALRSIPPLLALRARASRAHRKEQPMFWSDLRDDVRHTARRARKQPLVTATVVITMTLGLAVTTAVFSVVDAVLLRPLPFAESERVVELSTIMQDGTTTPSLSHPDLMDFRAHVAAFAEVTAMQRTSMTLQRGSEPRRLRTAQVDDAYGRVFALRPLLGRLFTRGDLVVGGPKRVVLGYDLWRTQLGADRAIVGRTVQLDEEPYEVIGVLGPSAFDFPVSSVEALTPLVIYPNSGMDSRGSLWAQGVAKLAPDVSMEEARRQAAAVFAGIAEEYPKAKSGMRIAMRPLRDAVVGDVRQMLMLLAGAVAAVLLVASTNVANLLLGDAVARSREFALRVALGGSAQRVRRQVVTESLALAMVGGTLGLLLAPVVVRAIVLLYPSGLPRAAEVTIDWRVFVAAAIGATTSAAPARVRTDAPRPPFTRPSARSRAAEVTIDWRVFVAAAIATVVAGLLAGIPMARRAAARDLALGLVNGGRGASVRTRAGAALVVAQVAACTTLLFAAGVLLETFSRLQATDPGFSPRGVLTARVAPPYRRYGDEPKLTRFYAELAHRVAALPGVTAATSATEVPLSGGSWTEFVRDASQPQTDASAVRVSVVFADAGYERALGIPLRAGRGLLETDDASAPRVVMVDERTARRLYPGVNPVRRSVRFVSSKEAWIIVGVLGSVMSQTLAGESLPQMIVPARQFVRPWRYLVVRASPARPTLAREVASTLHALDSTIALTDVKTMDDRVAAAVAPQRFRAVLVGGLGLLAIALAVVGIYGVVAYAVSKRTREIGIRLALGENARRLRWRVVGGAVGIAAIGTMLGVVGALAVGRWLAAFLAGASARDPLMLAAASGLLLLTAAAAAYAPAVRASRVDPMEALRAE